MADLRVTGLDDLMLSMQQIAELPEAVQNEMLFAAADVIVPAQRNKIRAYGIYDSKSTKHVADSIKAGKVKLKKGQRVLYVSPTGSRRRGNTVTRNAEILFINEYGATRRGIKARPAVRDANEEAADAAVQAQEAVLDRFYKSKNL